MASPSSTSSSKQGPWGRVRWARAPWAAMAAVVMIVGLDSLVLGWDGPWERLVERAPAQGGLRGLVAERIGQKTVRDRPADHLGFFVAGSSRALHGFSFTALTSDDMDRLTLAQIGRPSMGPFEIMSVTEELLRAAPDGIVIFGSEFDTHRPIQVVPKMSNGNLRAIVGLIQDIGPGFTWRQRHDLYRLVAVESLYAYRYRDLLGATALNRLRRFPTDDERFAKGTNPPAASLNINPLNSPEYRARRDETYRRLRPRLPEDSVKYRAQVRQIFNIQRGPHVDIQESQLRRAVETFTASDVAVLIVEAPLHPIAEEIYDVDLRQDFLTFASELAEDPGVSFLPLDPNDPFTAEDFKDLTHLNRPGGERLTRRILDTFVPILEARAQEDR